MAQKGQVFSGSTLSQGGSASQGWGNQVLNILFTVFIISIVFGVILIATTTSNTTLTSLQNQLDLVSTATVNSVQANTMNVIGSGNVVLTWSGATQISATNPVTVTVKGNTVTTAAVNAPAANAMSNAAFTLSFVVTSNAQYQVSNAGSIYNISTISVAGLLPGDTGATATVTEYYFPNAINTVLISPASRNTISAVGTITSTAPTVGTTGTTPVTVFNTLAAYLVTISNFVGIIILLAIIVVVIGVLYFFFGNRGTSAFGGSGGGL